MNEHPDLKNIDVGRLKQLLADKKYGPRPNRRRRLRAMGRVVEVPGLPPPHENGLWPLSGALLPLQEEGACHPGGPEVAGANANVAKGERFSMKAGRWLIGHSLLLFEMTIVVVFLLVVIDLWYTTASLNREMVQVQRDGDTRHRGRHLAWWAQATGCRCDAAARRSWLCPGPSVTGHQRVRSASRAHPGA